MRRLFNFIVSVADLYFTKQVSRSAAALAYFLILTFFPVLICVNAFVGLLRLDVGFVLETAGRALPTESLGILGEYLNYVNQNQSPALLAAGLSGTLFSAAAAFRILMSTMDELYDRKSYQGVWQVVASLLFSVLFLATIYLSVTVIFTGEWLFRWLSGVFRLSHAALPWDWQWLRFLLLFVLVLLFVLLVYRISAPRRAPVFLGGILAAVTMVGASVLFSWFIGLSARYSLIYGSLASVIVLLVWLYLCGTILMLGNVVNCVWYKKQNPGGGG